MANVSISILNIVGLTINFIGVVMMFKANTKISTKVGLPDVQDILDSLKDEDNTRLFRRGMIVLCVGFFIQLIAGILSLF